MTRCPLWTPRRSCGSWPACAARWPAGRSCWPRSGCRRSRWPTGSRCPRRARTSRGGRGRSPPHAAALSPRCLVRTPLRRSPPTGLRRLRRHVAQRRGWLALLLACAIVEAFAQSGSWLLVRLAINEGIVPRDDHVLALASAAYLAVSITGWALFGVVIRGMARFGQELVLGLRRELFDHLTSLSLRYFSEQRAGWIIARLTSDVDAISDVLSQGLPTLVTNAVLLPAAITALFINDWRLALVSLVVLPPAIVLTRWFQRRSAAAQLEVRNRIAAVTAHLAESVAGMAIVQSFRRESGFQARFDELNADNREASVTAQRISSQFF